MATKANKKKRAKKSRALPSGDGVQDQAKEPVQITPDPLRNSGPSHELLGAAFLADDEFHQFNETQCQDGEHQGGVISPVSAQEQFTDGHSNGKKSKKKHKKKTSAMKPHSSEHPTESLKEEKSFTFEEQVEWCIGQLELGLYHHDATKAQKDSNEKNVRTLRSLKVPVPRKRQLMRSLFGDYRSKMMATPLPETRTKEPCVNAVEREVAEDCGKFFKYKRSHGTALLNGGERYNHHSEEQEQFFFDFVINS